MELVRAFRIQPGEIIAFTGAGGKTSAIFTIARQLPGPVIITTTTHISQAQAAWGDRHWRLENRSDFDQTKRVILNGGVHVITGGPAVNLRVPGPEKEILDCVQSFCRENGITLLVEADGSKMRPLKAPAAHEPAVPVWAGRVVVCAGLRAVGQPLDHRHVHRPEAIAAITGKTEGSTITIDDIKQVFLSGQGGLKGIPSSAARVALFNQTDTPELQSSVLSISSSLLGPYDSVVVSKSTSYTGIGANKLEPLAVHEKCAGIILAAGQSARLGSPKQLLDWRGKPFLWHVVQASIGAGLDPIYVVTGAESQKITSILDGLPVHLVYNPDWEKGQSTSVRAGIQSLPKTAGSAIFLMSDQPQVEPLLIQSLVETHSRNLPAIVAPMIDGRRGNPVLFDRCTFKDLLELQGDTGGRAIFSKHPVEYLPWSDARMLMDVDTPEDYQNLLGMDGI